MEKFNLDFYRKNMDNDNVIVYLVEYRLDGKKPNIMSLTVKYIIDNKVFFIPNMNEEVPQWFIKCLKHRDIQSINQPYYIAEFSNHEYEVRINNLLVGDLYYHIHNDNEYCFLSDSEKITDFVNLSKSEFLKSYSYLREIDYEETQRIFDKLIDNQH